MTDAERWQRVEAIFHDVADLPAGPSRTARIRELGNDDAGICAEVDGLLAEDDALRAATAESDPHLGLRLGAYRVDALVARGGMAAVYAAVRADETFQQRVAVKIMDLRLSDPALVRQFAAERQILATLEHPALTRLLDGGVTALGEPYLIMEFVDGVPIDRYCDEYRLALAARLQLLARATPSTPSSGSSRPGASATRSSTARRAMPKGWRCTARRSRRPSAPGSVRSVASVFLQNLGAQYLRMASGRGRDDLARCLAADAGRGCRVARALLGAAVVGDSGPAA